MRLDEYLVVSALAPSRSRAKALIVSGAVTVNGKTIRKPAFFVSEKDAVTVSSPFRYVSRGGEKLAAALAAFSVSCEGRVVLDIGASSGGFTDCARQNGAALVYAVENGHGQLAESLLADPAVISMEHYNARCLQRTDFSPIPTLAVMDVSFISQTLILPALAEVLPAGGELISLIKPQFEAGRSAVGRGGLVRREEDRRSAIARVVASAGTCGFSHRGVIVSPILGGDGNVEYLSYFVKEV